MILSYTALLRDMDRHLEAVARDHMSMVSLKQICSGLMHTLESEIRAINLTQFRSNKTQLEMAVTSCASDFEQKVDATFRTLRIDCLTSISVIYLDDDRVKVEVILTLTDLRRAASFRESDELTIALLTKSEETASENTLP